MLTGSDRHVKKSEIVECNILSFHIPPINIDFANHFEDTSVNK